MSLFTFSLIMLGFCSCSVYSWIINNIDVPRLVRQLKLDVDNELSAEELAQHRFNLIYPGTKWCGAGNVAESYDDLGYERAADICCREHDSCPDLILAGETKHNLTNEAFYTRLSCKCDEQFRRCLRNSRSGAADNIGTVYFNALATKCFRSDYPTLGCVRRGGWLNRKCLEYTYDTSGMKVYQWFDVSNY